MLARLKYQCADSRIDGIYRPAFFVQPWGAFVLDCAVEQFAPVIEDVAMLYAAQRGIATNDELERVQNRNLAGR